MCGKFVRASLRGWRDYMNDPTAANETISKLNPAMSRDQMAFTYQALKDGHFITGSDPSGSNWGSSTRRAGRRCINSCLI